MISRLSKRGKRHGHGPAHRPPERRTTMSSWPGSTSCPARRSRARGWPSPSASRPGTRWRRGRSPLGEPMRKFDQIIGFATQDIGAGRAHPRPQLRHARVRARLCGGPGRAADRDGAGGRARARSAAIVRGNGKVGTRNYIGILSTVNCSASVSQVHRRAVPGRGAGAVPERRRRSSPSPTAPAAAWPTAARATPPCSGRCGASPRTPTSPRS